MLLIPNATNEWMKSRFSTCTSRKSAKLFTKNSCQAYTVWNPACNYNRCMLIIHDFIKFSWQSFLVNNFADFVQSLLALGIQWLLFQRCCQDSKFTIVSAGVAGMWEFFFSADFLLFCCHNLRILFYFQPIFGLFTPILCCFPAFFSALPLFVSVASHIPGIRITVGIHSGRA